MTFIMLDEFVRNREWESPRIKKKKIHVAPANKCGVNTPPWPVPGYQYNITESKVGERYHTIRCYFHYNDTINVNNLKNIENGKM